MSLISALNDGINPADLRVRKVLGGQFCKVCGVEIPRLPEQSSKQYRSTKTCKEHRPRARRGENEFSCVSCAWRFEDSDIGEHCRACSTGQNYKRK